MINVQGDPGPDSHNDLHIASPDRPHHPTMPPPRASPKALSAAALAVAGLACALTGWWWVAASAPARAGPLLGLAGLCMMGAALAMLWRATLNDQRELHRAQVAAGRAFEHETAIQKAQQEASTANELQPSVPFFITPGHNYVRYGRLGCSCKPCRLCAKCRRTFG